MKTLEILGAASAAITILSWSAWKYLPRLLPGRSAARWLGRHRRNALTGTWIGYVINSHARKNFPKQLFIVVKLRAGLKRVIGENGFTSPMRDRGIIINEMKGILDHNNVLFFHYKKRNPRVHANGTMMLWLGPDPTKLEGQVMGHSSHTADSFHAKIVLRRADTNDSIESLLAAEADRSSSQLVDRGGFKPIVE